MYQLLTISLESQVFHATCHAEAVASTNSLAARLRTEVASGSRSGTPDAQSARCTPPKPAAVALRKSTSHSPSPQSKLAGTKRKAENDDPSLPADGTPPAKKLAIES